MCLFLIRDIQSIVYFSKQRLGNHLRCWDISCSTNSSFTSSTVFFLYHHPHNKRPQQTNKIMGKLRSPGCLSWSCWDSAWFFYPALAISFSWTPGFKVFCLKEWVSGWMFRSLQLLLCFIEGPHLHPPIKAIFWVLFFLWKESNLGFFVSTQMLCADPLP